MKLSDNYYNLITHIFEKFQVHTYYCKEIIGNYLKPPISFQQILTNFTDIETLITFDVLKQTL